MTMGEKDDELENEELGEEQEQEDEPGAEDEGAWFRPNSDNRPDEGDMPDYSFRDDTRRSVLIAGSIILVFLFAGIVWWLYYDKNRDHGEPPLVTADSGPVKEKPEDPGGMEVPNQDRLVFDTVSGEQTELEDSVQPGPEEPAVDEDTTIEDIIRETEPQPSPRRTAEAEVETASAEPAEPAPTTGQYVVQLGAFGTREAAGQAWATVESKFPQILTPLVDDIERAELSGGRVLYRLRAGYFATRDEADRLCQRLKELGQDCLATAR